MEIENAMHSKKTKKILSLLFIFVVGLYVSGNLMNHGLMLLIESGVSVTTLKVIVGIIYTTAGFALGAWCLIKPASVFFIEHVFKEDNTK